MSGAGGAVFVDVAWEDGARTELAAACAAIADGAPGAGGVAPGGHQPDADDVPDDESLGRLVAASVMEAGDLPLGGGLVAVRMVTLAASSRLNLAHRGKPSATDVLAFPLDLDGLLAEGDPFPGPPPDADEPPELGDLAICPAFVARQLADGDTMLPAGPGQERGDATLREALERCAVHGTLHLLGHDHELGEDHARHMFELEQRVLDGVRAGDGDDA